MNYSVLIKYYNGDYEWVDFVAYDDALELFKACIVFYDDVKSVYFMKYTSDGFQTLDKYVD